MLTPQTLIAIAQVTTKTAGMVYFAGKRNPTSNTPDNKIGANASNANNPLSIAIS
jgi:hypothetical protein